MLLERPFGDSLWGRVLDEFDTLGDVALKDIVASREKLLLVFVGAADDIDGLFSTAGLWLCQCMIKTSRKESSYAKLDGNGEEVGSSDLCNGIAARHTGKIDKAGLDDALLALEGLDDLLRKAVNC
jgi:hypothetical protein